MRANILKSIPVALTSLRLVLAPLILWAGWSDQGVITFSVILAVALFSDIFDGVIARRLNIATAKIRAFDSAADSVFWFAAIWAICLRRPLAFHEHLTGIFVVIAIKLIKRIVDYWKFHRSTAYHMWSAKACGLILTGAAILIWADSSSDAAFDVAITAVMLAYIESLIASFLLPRWIHDVPTVAHAWRLRKSLLAEKP